MHKKQKYFLKPEDFLYLGDNCNAYWTDEKNRVLDVNNTQFLQMKGLLGVKSKQELIGKPLNKFLPKEISDPIISENNMVMKTGHAHVFFNIIQYKNYQSVLSFTLKTPLYDSNEKIVGVFGISQHLSIHSFEDKIKERLTKREYECLFHLLKGHTAREIGAKLHLSKRTIEFYISNIKSKLGCTTKSDLVNKVYDLGLSVLMLRDSGNNATSGKFELGNFIPQALRKHEKIK